ncbi:MAG: DUF432 domain-containing protein [Methanomicrobiales archaeon]|nr:DUF432 domain-containing protein [Methanomicrobiales archaeon]
MFGRYNFPLAIKEGNLTLQVEKRNGFLLYMRDLQGDRKEKLIGSDINQIIIHPIVPITIPKQISLYLEISFDPIFVGPTSKVIAYLTFPIEIGVFLESGSTIELLDTFSFVSSKYSLYGTPKTGVITKWYKSKIFSDVPPTDYRKVGVLKLIINNPLRDFAEVSRAVFNGRGMVLFFDNRMVAIHAQMSIQSSLVAETNFFETSFQSGMEKSIELLKAKQLTLAGVNKIRQLSGVEGNKFFMDAGYS